MEEGRLGMYLGGFSSKDNGCPPCVILFGVTAALQGFSSFYIFFIPIEY